MDQSWILCRSKPNQQAWAVENVARVRPDYECYLPRWYNPDLRKVVYMFGNYLFVRVIQRQWHCLSGIWGMAYVLTNLDGACIVPDRDIERIKKLEDKHGVVRLNLRRLQPGARVMITAGPLKFNYGTFRDGKKDVCRVELDSFLGKSVTTLVDRKHVQPV